MEMIRPQARIAHRRDDRLDEQQRAEREVAQLREKVGPRQVVERYVGLRAGGVEDQDGDVSELRRHVLVQAADLVGVGDVGRERLGDAACLHDAVASDGIGRVIAAVVDRDPVPVGGQRPCDRRAEAPPAAGDEGHLPARAHCRAAPARNVATERLTASTMCAT